MARMAKHPVPPPVWALAAGGLQLALAGRRRPTTASVAASVVVGLGAGGLAGAAVAALMRADTTISPERPDRTTALVTGGPFRWTRNPIYLGLAGVLLAHAILRRSWLALAPVAGFVAVMDRVQVPAEERALRKRLGRPYDRYRAGTPRWLGATRADRD